MRALTTSEISKVAGGRRFNPSHGGSGTVMTPDLKKGPTDPGAVQVVGIVPPDGFSSWWAWDNFMCGWGEASPVGGGDGGVGGAGGTSHPSVKWGSDLNDDAALQTLVQVTGLSAELEAAGIEHVVVGTAPGGMQGDSGYYARTHTIYVSTSDWNSFQNDGKEGAVALAGDIAHELGHAQHRAPNEYTFKGSEPTFLKQARLSEGWATYNELVQERADEAHEYTDVTYAVSDSPQQAAIDRQTFDSDISQGKTPSQIAADLADDISGQQVAPGENYTQLFDSEYQHGQDWQKNHPEG